jgi:hypothetical protein
MDVPELKHRAPKVPKNRCGHQWDTEGAKVHEGKHWCGLRPHKSVVKHVCMVHPQCNARS